MQQGEECALIAYRATNKHQRNEVDQFKRDRIVLAEWTQNEYRYVLLLIVGGDYIVLHQMKRHACFASYTIADAFDLDIALRTEHVMYMRRKFYAIGASARRGNKL